MSADTDALRRTAALLVERAESATRGPWVSRQEHGRDHTDEGWSSVAVTSVAGVDVADTALPGDERERAVEDAEHIAALHPLVSLALAPLLERLAARADMVLSSVGSPMVGAAVAGAHIVGYVEAVSFARAYLGEEDPT